MTRTTEESKAEMKQLEIELRAKAALDEKHGRKGTINSHLAEIAAHYLKEK